MQKPARNSALKSLSWDLWAAPNIGTQSDISFSTKLSREFGKSPGNWGQRIQAFETGLPVVFFI